MKTTALRQPYAYSARRTPCRFPNSAQRCCLRDILLDAALAAAITLGVITILLFLLVL